MQIQYKGKLVDGLLINKRIVKNIEVKIGEAKKGDINQIIKLQLALADYHKK